MTKDEICGEITRRVDRLEKERTVLLRIASNNEILCNRCSHEREYREGDGCFDEVCERCRNCICGECANGDKWELRKMEEEDE